MKMEDIMRRGTRKFLAIILSIAMVFSTAALTPLNFHQNVWALTNEDITDSLVTSFTYDFAYTTPGYADGTIRIAANEDGVYKVFWGDAEGNKLEKNGYEYSYLARVIVKDGNGSYNIISDYTVIPEEAATVLVYKKDALQYVYEIPEDKLFAPLDPQKVDGLSPFKRQLINAYILECRQYFFKSK